MLRPARDHLARRLARAPEERLEPAAAQAREAQGEGREETIERGRSLPHVAVERRRVLPQEAEIGAVKGAVRFREEKRRMGEER